MAVTSKVTPKKEAVVAEIQGWLTTSKGVVLTSYNALNVATDTQLRRELRAAGVKYKVVKNTMLRIAAKAAGIEGLDAHLEGTTAMAFSTEDAVAPAKVLCDFIDKAKNDHMSVKIGLMGEEVMDVNAVKALASLPSREVLLARLVGSLNSSIAKLVYVLDAIRKQQAGEE